MFLTRYDGLGGDPVSPVVDNDGAQRVKAFQIDSVVNLSFDK